MNDADVDRIIERYAEERKHQSRQVAQEHLLRHVYVVYGAKEVEPLLKRTRTLAAYQIATLSLFENPFRNSQFCWLLLTLLWFGFNILLIVEQEHCTFGMINCAGTLILGSNLWKSVWSKWIDTSLLITYYQEILDCIDSQGPPFNVESAS